MEKANHSAAQRWWRTVPDGLTVVQAQPGVDKLSVRMDDRRRRIDGAVTTAGELAAAEPLLDIPVRPFPAELEVERTLSPRSLFAFDGNFYSVRPACPASRSRPCTGSARTTCGSSPPAGPPSPVTAGPREVPGSPSATTDMSPRWSGRCHPRSAAGLPARARSANRRQPQLWLKPSVCAKGRPSPSQIYRSPRSKSAAPDAPPPAWPHTPARSATASSPPTRDTARSTARPNTVASRKGNATGPATKNEHAVSANLPEPPPAPQPTAPGAIDPLAPTAVRNCPHCDQPVTIAALLATQEGARPHDCQPRHRHRPAQTPPVSFG